MALSIIGSAAGFDPASPRSNRGGPVFIRPNLLKRNDNMTNEELMEVLDVHSDDTLTLASLKIVALLVQRERIPADVFVQMMATYPRFDGLDDENDDTLFEMFDVLVGELARRVDDELETHE